MWPGKLAWYPASNVPLEWGTRGGGRAPPDSCSHGLLTSQMKLHRGQQAVKVASCIGVTGYATVDSAFKKMLLPSYR